jgi:hypothetical protein
MLGAFATQAAEQRGSSSNGGGSGIEELRLDLDINNSIEEEMKEGDETAPLALDLGPLVPRFGSPHSSLLRTLKCLGIARLNAEIGFLSLGRLLRHLPCLVELTLAYPEVSPTGLDKFCLGVLTSPTRGRALRTLQFTYPQAASHTAAEAASASLARALVAGAFPQLESLLVWYDYSPRAPAARNGLRFLGGDSSLYHIYGALLKRSPARGYREKGLAWLRVGHMSAAMANLLERALGTDGVVEAAGGLV